MGDKLRLAGLLVTSLPGLAGIALRRLLCALLHRWTYGGPTDTPKVVLVVGGSFAGYQLMARLAETLPTGWQAVLVEKNSHFNWSFNLPRFAVVPGHEHAAFIPYNSIFAKGYRRGITRFVQGEVVSVQHDTRDRDTGERKEVLLASGATLAYDVLVVATGSAQRPPAKLLGAADRDAACAELRVLQTRIRRARTVAVVGGGAVGVELATDIKTFAAMVAERCRDDDNKEESVADKEVTLVHSHAQLLNRFGPRLHKHVVGVLEKLGVRVELGQRPTISYADSSPDAQVGGAGTLHFPDGREQAYDCVLLCTGQTPNSALFREAYAGAITDTGEVRVAPTLQVVTTVDDDTDGKNSGMGMPLPDVFAFGDVAATGGAKMARAGYFQADVVAANILATIQGRLATTTATAMTRYTPCAIEASLKLTLGKDDTVVYLDLDQDEGEGDDGTKNRSILLSMGGDREDMHMKGAWSFLGVKYKDE